MFLGDIEPEVLENIIKRSVNIALDEKPTMDEVIRAIKGLKDIKTPAEKKYENTGEPICPTAMYHNPGRMPK